MPLVVHHDDCLAHDTGSGLFEAGPSPLIAVPEPHPESPARLRNIRSALERGPLASDLEWRVARPADVASLERVHTAAHVERIAALSGLDGVARAGDGSTFASPATWDAARAAAGCALDALDAVLDGESTLAYALARPPGHHAGPATVDGYCFFNNAALAAQRALDRGAERVAIVDWDVHHGNGTQACFWSRGEVLTISVHMDHRAWDPATHPESGTPDESGEGDGRGRNVNVALPFGCGDSAYAATFERVVAPALRAFEPEVLIGGAGQDASQFDPNGRMSVSMAGFHAIGTAFGSFASELCAGRAVLVQEGGYAPTYSAMCLLATLAGAAGRPIGVEDPLAIYPEHDTGHVAAIDATLAAHAGFGLL